MDNYGYRLFRRLARCFSDELAMFRLLSSFSALETRRHIPSQLVGLISQAYNSGGVARLFIQVATSLAVTTDSLKAFETRFGGRLRVLY